MPTAIPDLILCDAQTATGAGAGVIGYGDKIRYSRGTGVNRHGLARKFKARVVLRDSTTGATATVKIQHSDDNSTYTDLVSFVFAALGSSNQAVQAGLFTTTKKYIRANVTALTGGSAPTVDAYCTLGTWGM